MILLPGDFPALSPRGDDQELARKKEGRDKEEEVKEEEEQKQEVPQNKRNMRGLKVHIESVLLSVNWLRSN